MWEILHNPDFKRVEFDTFKKDAGTNAYTFSIKEWNQNLNGIGIVTKSGRYGGGIFAHTDAIKENLIIPKLTPAQKSFVYADEADLLNVAIFGKTTKEWRTENPKKKGNFRDYASISQLLVLANLESYNAILIEQKTEQGDRLELLRKTAVNQLATIANLEGPLANLPQLEKK